MLSADTNSLEDFRCDLVVYYRICGPTSENDTISTAATKFLVDTITYQSLADIVKQNL